MAFRVTHLATTASDGAGIAARRIHEALSADAAVDSRFLARDPSNAGPATQAIGQPPVAWTERLARRLPFALSPQSQQERALNALLAQSGPAPELFSLPHARARPEDHAWVKDADILHLHWVSGLIDYPRFFGRIDKPVVWTLHDQQPYLGGFHYDWDRDRHPRFASLERECLAIKRAALARLPRPPVVVGNSRWNTEAARASGFFPAGTRFETIYYPLDLSAYAPRDKAAAKAALGIPPGELVVGFACTGLDNARKGLADLLDALRLLENIPGHPPLTLVSFGRAPSETLRATLRSRWLHLGFLDTDLLKCAAYSAMDCFVIPSHAEAFGQTAIEALASGTSVIGADVGGIPETMPAANHPPALFPAGDASTLAQLLRAQLEAPGLRARLAEQGRAHVLAQHTARIITPRYRALYSAIAEK